MTLISFGGIDFVLFSLLGPVVPHDGYFADCISSEDNIDIWMIDINDSRRQDQEGVDHFLFQFGSFETNSLLWTTFLIKKDPSKPLEEFNLIKEKCIFNMKTHMCTKRQVNPKGKLDTLGSL